MSKLPLQYQIKESNGFTRNTLNIANKKLSTNVKWPKINWFTPTTQNKKMPDCTSTLESSYTSTKEIFYEHSAAASALGTFLY